MFAPKFQRFVGQPSTFEFRRYLSNHNYKTELAPLFDTSKPEKLCNCDDEERLSKCSKSHKCKYRVDGITVHVKTYGCQMNVNDTSVVKSVLKDYGYKLIDNEHDAEVELLMTCAIRESAESKIWDKLKQLRSRKNNPSDPLKHVGVLGCMAERLRAAIMKNNEAVDIVAGPDAYRDLPRLFAINRHTQSKAINCQYMFDETYSDIVPSTGKDEVKSFVSITRGCDNMCSFCIVPYTRGKERSRSLPSIVEGVKTLMANGIKEVTLLGQNVNSYRDIETSPVAIRRNDLMERVSEKEQFAPGFRTVYKPRQRGLTFDVLLEEVARVSPELRVRFTSPHPKDFTQDVIDVMSKYPNIAKCIHLPVQSGSNSMLKKMRRGYTREAYLDLVDRLRKKIPGLSLTTDTISGFCGETDEDHRQTIELIKQVQYNQIYTFKYSMRQKTHAYHNYIDDVEEAIKQERLLEIKELFRQQAHQLNKSKIGSKQLILIESDSKRSDSDWQGLSDNNVTTILPKMKVPSLTDSSVRPIRPGDYVICRVIDANSQTFRGEPICITTQEDFHSDKEPILRQINRIGPHR